MIPIQMIFCTTCNIGIYHLPQTPNSQRRASFSKIFKDHACITDPLWLRFIMWSKKRKNYYSFISCQRVGDTSQCSINKCTPGLFSPVEASKWLVAGEIHWPSMPCPMQLTSFPCIDKSVLLTEYWYNGLFSGRGWWVHVVTKVTRGF